MLDENNCVLPISFFMNGCVAYNEAADNKKNVNTYKTPFRKNTEKIKGSIHSLVMRLCMMNKNEKSSE